MDKELVARNLLRHRSRRGITQEQLAELSGVGIRTIQRIESAAAAPHLSTIALLAAALEIPVPALTEAAEPAGPAAPAAAEEAPAPVVSAGELAGLHLLPLLGLVLPLANVLAPLFHWLYRRAADARLETQGRAVLDFQLTLTLGMALAVGLLLTYFQVGLVLLAAVLVLGPLLSIVNARRALRGAPVRYPLAIPLLQRKKRNRGGQVTGR